ncbi:hypothetical protein FQR65_LT15953 [Abscondita terminalis]|nr:hypothetical protein FQR65_LT15953 [Abscondita terminalis]
MLTFLNKVDHKRESTSNVQCEETHSQEEDGETMSLNRSQAPPSQSTKDTPLQNVDDPPSIRPPSKRTRQNDKVLEYLDSR